MKLVFASHNLHKVEEVKALIPSSIQVVSLDEIGYKIEIPETGATLEENAKLKAEFVYNNLGYPCFADDSGLEVLALKGAPGVYSARYAGEEKIAENNMNKLLLELQNTSNRAAQFKTVIHLKTSQYDYSFTGTVEGTITTIKKGKHGFGYDPLFQPKGFLKTFAEMTLTEKATLSHRARAIAKLVAFLNSVV